MREMPYLWEVWEDTVSTSAWSLIPSSVLHDETKRLRAAAKEMQQMQQRHRWIITQEMPEHFDDFCNERPWMSQDVDAAIEPALAELMKLITRSEVVCVMPPDRTNWYVVYTQITRHWKGLQGLKNRAKIWGNCEDIASRIQVCIDEGKIEV